MSIRALNPDTSYVLLAHPDIAQRIGLTDEQRGQVSTILSERSAAIQQAAGDAKAELRAKLEYEEKLAAVLTPQQRAEWPDKVVQRTLRFNFRFQLWTDVLEWFAEQAGLSLVMNVPPPGTFNYSDPKPYTPEEAIDVLNSVLLTHGFTLIRRDKMLIVQDLSQGIPDGLIPLVDVKELDQRGNFELVTVSLPLGKRDPAAVTAEITPVKGVHGQIVSLPTTAQLLITDTARNVRTMAALIEAIPEPQPPKKEEPPREKPAPPAPELVVYPITRADPMAVQDILMKMVPTITMQFDVKRAQLYVYTTPNFQTTVAKVLENMDTDLPPEQQRTLEIYSIKDTGTGTPTASASMPRSSPSGDQISEGQIIRDENGRPRYRIDSYGRRIPISPEERRSRYSSEGGGRSYSGGASRFPSDSSSTPAETASTSEPSVDSFLNTLQQMIPGAELHLDQKNTRLIAFANPEEHEIIRSVIEKVGDTATADEAPRVEVYPITHSDPESLKTMFESLFPGVQINIDRATNNMVIFACPSEHTSIRETLDRLMAPPVDGQPGGVPSATGMRFQPPELEVYELTAADPTTTITILQELVPRAEITHDQANNRLIVLAPPESQVTIRDTLAQLQSDEDQESSLMVYSLLPGQRKRFQAVVESLADDMSDVKVIDDDQSTQLSVWAKPSEHRVIGEILMQLKAGDAAEQQKRFEAYPIQGAVGYESSHGGRQMAAATVMTGIQELVPGAKLMIDQTNDKLIAWASPEEHDILKAALEKLAPTTGENASQLQVFMLKKRAPDNLVDGLRKLAPRAEISIDSESKRLTVVGNSADQQAIQTAIDKIQSGGGEDGEPYFEIYPISGIPASNEQMAGRGYSSGRYFAARSFADQIEPFAPNAEITIDYEKGNLLVLGTAKEHAAIKAAVEKLAPTTGENALQLQVHMLKKRAPENLVDGLKRLAPDAEISIDSEFKRLTVVAKAAHQQTIQTALDKIQSGGGEDGEPYFEIYPVSGMPAANEQMMGRGYSSSRYYAARSFADQIEPFAPNAEITVDYENGNLLVLGTAKEHAAIKAAIEKLQAGGQNTPELQIYTLKNDVPETLAEGLAQLVPHAKINIDKEARQISVVATTADHKTVKGTLDKIETAAGEKEKPYFKVYAVTAIETNSQYSSSRFYAARDLMEQLQKFVPKASISIDFTTGNLLVFATQEEHTAIESAIAGLTGTGSAENPATVAVYRMNNADERAVFQLLQNLVPKAKLSFDYRTDSIMAYATAEDHEVIKATIAQLDLGADNPNTPELRFHTMQQAPPRNLIQGLEELAPKAEITYDPDSRQLMVIATATEHTIIEKNLKQIEETAAAEDKTDLVVYPIASADMDSVQSVLKELYPDIRIQLDEKNDRIIVTAMPDQHEKVAAAIKKMDSNMEGGSEEKTVAYSVSEVDAKTAIQILQSLVENMQLHPDASGTKIVAFGRERDHKIVAEAIEQMESGPDETHKPYLMVYPTGDADPTTLTQILANLAPKAKVVVDTESETLAVFALPKDQETVRSAIESMAITAIGAGKPMAMTYSLKKIPAASATQILRLAVPVAQTATGSDPQQLIVWANAKDQATVKATLESVDVELPEGAKRTAAVYALEGINPNYSYYSMRLIREAVPTASMTLGADPTQVVVWATPEEHETIKELVKSIVEQPPELMPVMEIYPLEEVDALVAIKMLQGIVRDAELSVGSNAGQLVAWARPKDQETIKEALAKLTEADASPTAPTMEIYKLESGDAPSAIKTLTSIAPDAEFSVGKDADQLIVWARPTDHEKIKAAVTKIDAAGPKPTMKIYTLEKVEALSVLRMLRSIVPEAASEIGSDSRQLVVWATEEDHVKIANAIQQMSAIAPEGKVPIAVTYELNSLTAATAEQILKEIAPAAKFTVGDDEYQLIIWARPDEHKEIEETLQRIDLEGTGGGSEKAVIYELEGDGRQLYFMGRFLEQVVPKARFTPGANPNQLVAWARPKDHEQIKELIEQLADEENAPTAVVYDAGNVPAPTVTASLRQIVPEAVVTPGATPSELVVWTDPKSHEKVKEVVDKLKADGTPERVPTAVTYSLAEISAATATQILRLAVPQAQVSPGTESYQLLIWARPIDHTKVEETLKQVDVPGPEDKEARAVAYKLSGSTATKSYYILQFLAQSVPAARFTMGVAADQIIAWAQPKVHDEIVELLEQIQGGAENAPKLVVYELKNVAALSALTMLRSVVPEAVPTVGTDPYQLAVWASGDDHEKVKQLVEELSAAESPETAPRAVTYSLEEIATASAIQILQLAVPQARVNQGAETYQLLVWARPDDHTKVEEILAQIDVPGPEAKEAKAVAYKLDGSTATQSYYILQFLTQSVRTARFTMGVAPDQIIAWAQPKVHEEIVKLIEQIQGGKENSPKPVVYKLKNASAAVVSVMLRQMVPGATASPGMDPYELVVWARGDEHEKIAKLVDELSAPEPPETAPVPANYVVEEITAAAAMSVLRTVVPQAQLTAGADQYQFVALARPDDHELIKETLARIDIDGPEDKQAKLAIYDLKNTSATAAISMVRQIAPTALTTVGATPYQLIVWARPDEHEDIQKAVDQLAVQDAPDKAFQAITYTLEEVSTTTATEILKLAVPQAQVSPGAETYQLVVWARPDDHKLVEATLKQIDVKGPEDKQASVISYKLDGSNATQNYYILRFLAQSVPTARFTMGVAPDQIIAWAQPKDHEEIAELVKQVQGGEDSRPEAVVYALKNVTSQAVSVMVRQVVPEAVTTPGTDPYQIVIWARPSDHEKVKQIVEELSAADSPETAPRAVTYTLEEITAQSAMAMLRLAVPQAQLSAGAEPYQLMVWARPDDQVLVEQTLQQIDVKGPDDKLATAKVYELGIGDIRQMIYVLQFLQNAIPEARFTLGSSAKTIVAWARPKDHEEIQKLVNEFAETPETTPRVVIYSLQNTTAASAMQMLASTFPLARFNIGTDPYQLIVWARGEDHARIAEAVTELSKTESEETAPRLVVYPLESANATQVTMILRSIAPEARLGVGANARQLSVWARPADHAIIKKAIEEMAKKEPEETAPRVEVYTTETVDAKTAMSVLLSAVPEVTVTAGTDARQLVVFARPSEHEKVKATLDQLAQKGPPESQPTIVVYSLGTAGAAQAIQILTPVVPQAKFTMSTDPTKLIAWAYPEDHALIKAAVEQIEADSWLDGNRTMSVYPMKPEDVQTLMDLIDPVVRRHAQFLADPQRESLIVWADKRYNDAIKRTVEEFKQVVPEIVEPTAVVYRFEKADLATTSRILQTLVPEARIAFDYRAGSLVATAMPEDHEKIRQAIEEMNRDAIEMAPQLQVHQITSADPTRVLSVLTNLFRGEYTVQLSLDDANDALIAYASPLQQQKIAELIAEIEKGSKLDTANQLKLYDLKNVDGYAAESVLADMFQRQGVRVDLTVDRYRNQLVVMARPEQHDKIAEVLEQFRIEDRQLEIFQLEFVELTTANLAIRQLFADESFLSQPEVNPDPATGQLFVKASVAQLEEIRKLLIRMGETNLVPARQSSTGNLRVVPFKGDTKKVIEEIQKVWPSLRPNEIRVVTPEDLAPPPAVKSRLKPETAQPTKEPADPKENAEPKEQAEPEGKKSSAKPTGPSGPQGKEGTAGPAGPDRDANTSSAPEKASAAAPAPAQKNVSPTAPATTQGSASAAAPAPAQEDASAAAPAPAQEDAAAPADQQPAAPAAKAATQTPAAPSQPPAEVLIIAGDGSFTIASEDKEALDELESLLRTIAARTSFASRDYSVFQIKNTTASQIAQTLQQLFRTRDPRTAAGTSSPYGYGRSGYGRSGYGYGAQMQAPLIVPDDRLNTILVKGTRADRQTIEGLLEILDTAEMAESVATAFEPKTIPIKNTQASRVMQMVQSLYRSYFTAGMANSNFTPQITVDEITNSLIVKASPAVLDEITKFAQSLDTAADEDAAQRLHVIRLKSANALRVQEMLNAMLRGGTSTYRSTTPYRTTPYRAPSSTTPYRPR